MANNKKTSHRNRPARKARLTRDLDWVCRFAGVIHTTMRNAGCPVNSCVEAACIAVGAAQQLGHFCEPIPVAVRVTAGDQATALPGPPARAGDGYNGHLLIHFPGVGTADLTCDQFDNPRRGLYVPAPLVFPASREQVAGGIEVPLPRDTWITYRELPGDVSWRALPAWTESSALAIGAAVRQFLALP